MSVGISWVGKWRRFHARSPEDRGLILHASVVLSLTQIGLRSFGFQRWKELIERFSLSARPAKSLPADRRREVAVRAARAVRSIEVHWPFRPNCLERSIALWWLLRSEAVEGELHVGARRESGRFEAHAWVELDGQVLNDGPEVHDRYTRFNAPIAANSGSQGRRQGDPAYRV